MSERRLVHITPSGEVTIQSASTGLESWRERVDSLRAVTMEQMPNADAAEIVVQAVCDGCSTHVRVDPAEPELPDGWVDTGHGDYCPDCQ